jgi:3-oxoacyl-[acyl-carrier-protein] synthase II
MFMSPKREVVITGIGIVSPIGIGKDPFWQSLSEGRSGVRQVAVFQQCGRPAPIGAEIADFDPKQYVRPRKSLKVMSRDIQLAFAAADMAYADSGLRDKPLDPERGGVVFGADMIACELSELAAAYVPCITDGQFDRRLWASKAMPELYPLWMLKYLPNMPACHIGIAEDLRGPNNSLIMGEVSALSAIVEASRVIQRGQADALIAGGVSSRVHPMIWSRYQAMQYSQRGDNPPAACRPFDAQRDGMINGEGAGALILETRAGALARGATIHGRVLGFASTFEPHGTGQPLRGTAIRNAIRQVLDASGIEPRQIAYVNAHGMSTTLDDRLEAQAIRDTLGDIPVTALKSYFGNLGAGSDAVELAASVLAFEKGCVPPTLNYEHPDPECPVNVIHGAPGKQAGPVVLKLSHAMSGQAVALLLGAPD